MALKEREISRFTGYRPVLPLVNFQGCLLVNTRHSDCSGNLKGENRQWEMDGIFLLKIKKKREKEKRRKLRRDNVRILTRLARVVHHDGREM